MKGRPGWNLWLAQIAAILRLELKRNFLTRRAIPVYLLAAAPVVLFGVHALMAWQGWTRCRGRNEEIVYAGMFQLYYLRLGVFFGCVSVFMNLFRGEVLEKSLHYYLLAPVRRELLAMGKYLAGLVMAGALFCLGASFSHTIVSAHVASARNQELLAGPWLAHLGAYAGVTALAVIGYGAVFLFMGVSLRNPLVPAFGVLIWESINVFLPPLLKRISVIFYLESLCPVQIPASRGRVFAMAIDPPAAWLAVPGLLCLALAAVAVAALRIRRMEISYGTE